MIVTGKIKPDIGHIQKSILKNRIMVLQRPQLHEYVEYHVSHIHSFSERTFMLKI